MLIQEQSNIQYFKEFLDKNDDYAVFLKNQRKQYWNFTKEQQKFCKYING